MVNSNAPIDGNEETPEPSEREPIFNAPLSMVMLSLLLLGLHFLFTLQSDEEKIETIIDYALFPKRFFSEIGSELGYASVVDAGIPFITHGLMHADWAHVGLNAVFALAFGTGVLKVFGVWRTLTIYVLSQFGGAVLFLAMTQILSSEAGFAIGASGAVSGLTGVVFLLMAGGTIATKQFALLSSVFVFGNIVLAIVGPALFGSLIAWEAHIGGYVVGCILASIMLKTIAET
ncbi:rhomboid family intramembrane serine protease [Hirschia maritima]|uniref:rhomboid family intramembrane serine protease n=1 Tax=Hirschia maritima TaxID=1121961 RepID=UPI00036164F1|nr:rhomboid family intramembrane serine protease [Hirschia maritima]